MSPRRIFTDKNITRVSEKWIGAGNSKSSGTHTTDEQPNKHKDSSSELKHEYSKEAKNRKARSLASLQRSDIIRVSKLLRNNGEILQMEPWLYVVAWCLTSASEGMIRSRRQFEQKAPFWRGQEDDFFKLTMSDCGLVTTLIERQKMLDKVWAERNSQKYYGLLAIDKIGLILGVTPQIRREAGVRLVGAIGENPEIRKAARRHRDKEKKNEERRNAGRLNRADYEANSLSKLQPWKAEGISRASWYRRRSAKALGRSETNLPSSETSVARRIYNRVDDAPVSDVSLGAATARSRPVRRISLQSGRHCSNPSLVIEAGYLKLHVATAQFQVIPAIPTPCKSSIQLLGRLKIGSSIDCT